VINREYLKTGFCRLALATLLLAVAPGCAKSADEHTAAVQIDPAAAQYVARFEESAASYGRAVTVTDLVVEFGEVEAVPGESGGARGVCSAATGQTPVVTLSREAWDRSSDAEREELVFHELGHCLLGLTHEAGINSDGIPTSVMNPTEIGGAIYKQYREFYLRGLFGK
jgi:hypothetical protein